MNDQSNISLHNTTGLEFEPVNEEYREYDYIVDGGIVTLRIDQPRYINIHPEHGAHRILDAQGVSHYLPGHWLTRVGLRWKANEGEPHFSFTVAPTGNEYADVGVDACSNGCGCEEAHEAQADVPAFALPEAISDLFGRLGRGDPFNTEELEVAAAFFRLLEEEIGR